MLGGMDISQPLRLLGGLSPAQFMKRHWQKKPLLVRQAIPGFQPLLSRPALFDLAADAAVESRLLRHGGGRWTLRQGPLPRRGLPPLGQPDWTLLVQGVDLHHAGVHALLRQFRFVPDARLDDVMISYATEGGGVGPHFDSYDVFLLQAHGRRRWRIGRQKDLRLVEGLPLKILADFEPEEEYVLDPGDMLYLPPRWAHDGVALGECMTYSIGFRQPARGELARELLQRLADEAGDGLGDAAYRDPGQAAVAAPGAVPPAMFDFARDAVERGRRGLQPDLRPRATGHAAGRVADRAQAERLVRHATRAGRRGRRRGARPPHAHDVRRAARLHQRRGLPRQRPRCSADAATGGRAQPRRRPGGPAKRGRPIPAGAMEGSGVAA